MDSRGHKADRKVYCVGLFRTGTNTIVEILKNSFRAAHEFMLMPTWFALRDYMSGAISRAEFVDFVKRRDADGGLEVDSAGFNFLYVDILLDINPDAKFILTIRDCYSWTNSCIDALMSKNETMRTRHGSSAN